MGYDAHVACRCYQDGKIPPPPFAEHLAFENGCWELHLPHEGNQQIHEDYEKWYFSGCPHEDMWEAQEYMANVGGMAGFRGAIKAIGVEHLPALNREICLRPGQLVNSEAARAMLIDIETFRKKIGLSRGYKPDEFVNLLEALQIICEASVRTGNPIVW